MPNNLVVKKFKEKFSDYKYNHCRSVGIECEIPVVMKEGQAAPLSIIQDMFCFLGKRGFKLELDEYSNLIVAAKRINKQSAAEFEFHTDSITTDTGFSTVEIVLAPQKNLQIVEKNLSIVINLLTSFFFREKMLDVRIWYSATNIPFPQAINA